MNKNHDGLDCMNRPPHEYLPGQLERVPDRSRPTPSVRFASTKTKAGLAYTLSEAADEGHCYLPAPNLMTDAAKILRCRPS